VKRKFCGTKDWQPGWGKKQSWLPEDPDMSGAKAAATNGSRCKG
jgi:hypothetical protein